jgi:integrase
MNGKVYQRHGRWWISYRHQGQEIRQSVARALQVAPAAVTEAQAKRLLKDRLAQIATGRFAGIQGLRLTVAQVLDDYLAWLKQRGARAYGAAEDRARAVKADLGTVRAATLTPTMIRAFMDRRLAAGYAAATVSKGEVAVLRAAFRMAQADERLTAIPRFPSLQVDNAREGFVNPGEFQAIAAALGEPYRDAVTFTYLAARRIGEVVGIPWAWVDRESGEIRWPPLKNGRRLTLPLTPALRAIIERRWQARAIGDWLSPWVFHVGRRGHMSLSGLRYQWQKAAGKAGRPELLLHDLRRSGIRNMRRLGIPRSVAKKISGHLSDSVFQRYDIVDIEDRTAALEKVEGQFLAEGRGQRADSRGRIAELRIETSGS